VSFDSFAPFGAYLLLCKLNELTDYCGFGGREEGGGGGEESIGDDLFGFVECGISKRFNFC
jgi:hypothetical protein